MVTAFSSFSGSFLREVIIKNSEFHLTQEEINKVVEATKTLRDRSLIRTLAQTGMRRFEVAEVRIEDINFDQRLLYVPHGKGGKPRIIPFTQELLEDMKILAEGRCQGHLFLSNKGKRLSLRQINHIVAAAGRRSGVTNPNPKYKNITCHLFRHSFSRLWKEKGGSIESLSKILGHSSVKSTWDLYGTEDLKTIQENYRKIMEDPGEYEC